MGQLPVRGLCHLLTPNALDKAIRWITTLLAVLAGLVLTAMALVTVVSITGRGLVWAGLTPIPGDFELVEMGCAIAVFGFLPYCHLNRGHVTVDLFVSRLPDGLFNLLTLLGDIAIGAIAAVVGWRMWFGLQEKIAYGESTMILGAPLWIGYSLSFVGALWMIVIGLYVVYQDLRHVMAHERLP